MRVIYSDKDTVKQCYCYNRIELWLRISSQEFQSGSVQPLAATRGTLRFRGTPVEKHWSTFTTVMCNFIVTVYQFLYALKLQNIQKMFLF